MTLSCARAVRLSLASVGGHASESERLELEAHLAACARCSAGHADLAALRALRAAEPEGLSSAARERVRRSALAGARRAPVSAPRRWGPVGIGAALAVAGIATLLLIGRPATGDRVVGGDVAISKLAPSTDGVSEGALIVRSVFGGEVRLGEAETSLAESTSLVWRRASRSIELREGSVTVDVEHRAGQHFQVRTARFVVEVIGTRFTVDLGGVRTERGTVRIFAIDGTPLGYVAAGRSWTFPAAAVPAPPPEAPPAPPVSLGASAAAPPPAAPAARPPAEDGPAARLGQARRALARGNAGEARRLVEPIFHLGREMAVEARAIYAESFLTEGRYTDAVDGYETVVRDFPRTPEAESALYAVAQLQSEHGRPDAASTALERYLERYPHGRFAREASDRLAELTAPRR